MSAQKDDEEEYSSDLCEAALQFLRPYVRDKNCRPIDIVRLPATDTGDVQVQFSAGGDPAHWPWSAFDDAAWTITVSFKQGRQRSASFSVKELYVEIEKELKRRYIPSSPRDLAKQLIRRDVERGATLRSLADGGQGWSWFGYDVRIGGFVEVDGERKSLDCWHIWVSEYEGKPCQHIFKLGDIYSEVCQERKLGGHIEQPPLF